MDWQYRRVDQVTAGVDNLIVVATRNTIITRDGSPIIRGDWNARVMRDDGSAILMTSTDTDRDACLSACEEFIRALSLARERDPQPQNGT